MTTKLVMRGQCEPFLHLSIGAATMVNVSWFISFVCGINYHVTIDLTQVKVSFSKVLHFPKSFFTCFVINNCIEETSKWMLIDHKIMQQDGKKFWWRTINNQDVTFPNIFNYKLSSFNIFICHNPSSTFLCLQEIPYLTSYFECTQKKQ